MEKRHSDDCKINPCRQCHRLNQIFANADNPGSTPSDYPVDDGYEATE